MNASQTRKLERREELRKAWAKGLASGSVGNLDFSAIKRKVQRRLKRKRARA